jgi:hypothetical protein
LAAETRGTAISVLIGDPKSRRVSQVLPDPDAGASADTCEFRRADSASVGALASQIASLFEEPQLSSPGKRRNAS